MHLFDGNAHAKLLDQKIADKLAADKSAGKSIGTAAFIQIGPNESSEKYIRLKLTYCQKIGITAQAFYIDDKLADTEIFKQVDAIFQNPDITGGIIQLPLPRESLDHVLNLIPQQKDIDCLNGGYFNRLAPVVRAFDSFLTASGIGLKGLNACVIGQGSLVGKPVSHYLSHFGANVKILENYKTGDKLDCQLLILSAGVPRLVCGDDIAAGCSAVDFGSTVVNGKSVGDLDLNSSLEHLGIVSPSPGGMGPLVIRFLIFNFLGLS
jgi:methylenetetrahydrofolate dehydrogenase (NADP+) / methenyltetrahydrofolate cyclohydrolase